MLDAHYNCSTTIVLLSYCITTIVVQLVLFVCMSVLVCFVFKLMGVNSFDF